jgi:hypothetical protein
VFWLRLCLPTPPSKFPDAPETRTKDSKSLRLRVAVLTASCIHISTSLTHWHRQSNRFSSIHTSAHPRNSLSQHIRFIVTFMSSPRKSGRRSSAAASAALAVLAQAQSPTSSLYAAPESPSRPPSDLQDDSPPLSDPPSDNEDDSPEDRGRGV